MVETIAADGDIEEPAPAMPTDLSMVVLTVGDMPALRGYYRSLGWEEQPGASDALAIFRLGEISLALHPASDPTAGGASSRVPAGPPAVTLVVRVADGGAVDRACATAARAGAEVVSGPTDQSWGGRSALVADPEGNRWELLWVPGRPAGSARPPTD